MIERLKERKREAFMRRVLCTNKGSNYAYFRPLEYVISELTQIASKRKRKELLSNLFYFKDY